MIADLNIEHDFLSDDALIETLRPIGRDCLAAIVRTADLPNAAHRGARPGGRS